MATKLRVIYIEEIVKIRHCGTESHNFPNGTHVRVVSCDPERHVFRCEYLDGSDWWDVKPTEMIKISHLFKAKVHP